MGTSIVRLAAGAALTGSAAAIMVTTGSSCDDQCGNVLDATTPDDIVCQNSDFSGSTGTVLKNCMNCELKSTYYTTDPNSTDQQWLLYNSRYTLSECLWGEPGNNDVGDSPCITSQACGTIQNAFQYGNFSTSTSIGAYDYCNDWVDSLYFDGCVNCLRNSQQQYLANMVVMLQVGCDQKPSPGSAISVSGGIFSTTLMNETSPTPTSSWTNFNTSGPITLGAKVGIAIGGLCVVLAIAGFCIVWNGRRRRRAFLRKLEMQHKDSGWPHPFSPGGGGGTGGTAVVHRGPDMNETPLSQKPLRGWDDSPLSATASDPYYARYFSPYSSQQTSPVHGAGGEASMAMAQQWPREFHDYEPTPTHGAGGFLTAAQEKEMQDRHDDEEAAAAAAAAASYTPTPPMNIGLALGGDEPSLRSKVSEQSVQNRGGAAVGGGGAAAGNDNELRNAESYELHEVSSSAGGSSAGGGNNNNNNNNVAPGSRDSFRNRIARENHAPVLQHPGYGRYSPERVFPPPPAVHAMSGGLRDEADGEI